MAGAPEPEEAPFAGALLPEAPVAGDWFICWFSAGDCDLAVWLGLAGIGTIVMVLI